MKTTRTTKTCKQCGIELPEKTKSNFCAFHRPKRRIWPQQT